MLKYKYQLFGSKNSIDYDVAIFVDVIHNSFELNNKIVKQCNSHIHDIFIDKSMPVKKLNCNLVVVNDNIVVDCFKGTNDEINNSLYMTYDNHIQFYENQIDRLVTRDIKLKHVRVLRILLSFLSRTENRQCVKYALKSKDNKVRTDCLNNINLQDVIDTTKRNIKYEDYLKIISFQIGQIIGLLKGIELYTKNDIGIVFPDLANMINRNKITKYDLITLESYKRFLLIKTYNTDNLPIEHNKFKK